jgi:phage-related protein
MSKNIRLKASFYTNSLGNEPVRAWLKGLNTNDRKTIGEDIAYVQFKWPIGKPRVDHLRGDIWEVRSQIDNRIARTLFAVVKSEMVLLHGFIKKTQQTDPSEIELAQTRLKEWIKNENK